MTRVSTTTILLMSLLAASAVAGNRPNSKFVITAQANDTFAPYKSGDVPQTAADLWKDYDARKEPLDVQVVKEWKADGVVTRYVTFKVGTFKGAESPSYPETHRDRKPW